MVHQGLIRNSLGKVSPFLHPNYQCNQTSTIRISCLTAALTYLVYFPKFLVRDPSRQLIVTKRSFSEFLLMMHQFIRFFLQQYWLQYQLF